MRKEKVTFVTIVMEVMMLIICICLFILWKPGFYVCAGAFAGFGLLCSGVFFRLWLLAGQPRKKENMDPITIKNAVKEPKKDSEHITPVEYGEPIEYTVDAIIAEEMAADE